MGSKEAFDQTERVTGILNEDLARIRGSFQRCSDLAYRTFSFSSGVRGALLFINGLVDDARIEQVILEPLKTGILAAFNKNGISDAEAKSILELSLNEIQADQVQTVDRMSDAVDRICRGETALFMHGLPEICMVSLQKWEHRSVEEPGTEMTIRGPRDGFVEDIRINAALIRRRLPTPDLKMEALQVGRLSKTQIQIVYLDSIVMPGLTEEIKKRIGRIDIDAVLESSYIEELVADSALTLFPLMLNTERPDKVAASILEGRAAILVDNTPFALIAPSVLMDAVQTREDYYQNYLVSTALRWLRLWLYFSALVFPSIYVAVSTFHKEMIPTSLLLSIASSRENVPFPAVIEALLMEAAFEGLREAGIRLPRSVGQAVSIVGALVIGQAAVQAGIVSSTLVIVVSFTGIASFVFPLYNQGMAVRVLRFPMMLMAGFLGLYGVFLGLLMILIHLCKLRSFGVPYLSPVAPLHLQDLKDTGIRMPLWAMKNRPVTIQSRNTKRMRGNQRPEPATKR